MANLKEIRGRIASVRNTRKITAAMSRIAAARLQKAQRALLAARPYGQRMRAMVAEVVEGIEGGGPSGPGARLHPLLDARPITRELVVVVTADRGLCGGFNTNVGREAAELIWKIRADGHPCRVVCVGRKGASYLKAKGLVADEQRPAPEVDTVLALAGELAQALLAGYAGQDGEGPSFDRAWLVFNTFKNVLTQEVTVEQLLPFQVPEASVEASRGPREARVGRERKIEPDPRALLAQLLPAAVTTAIQQAFYNSSAAEIAARRSAMDAATDNASQLISDLTLEYNRERQAAITKELMEIIGGAEALRG